MHTKKFTNPKQYIRLIIIVTLSGILYNATRTQPIVNLFIFFTNWSVWAVLFTAIFGVFLASHPKYSQKRAVTLHALHHISYTLAMFMTPVVVVLYWSSLHRRHKHEIWENSLWHRGVENDLSQRQQLYRAKLRHTIAVHSIPALCTLILMFLNHQTVLMKRHFPYLVAFCMLYGYVNYLAVVHLRDGQPLYSFMTWRDQKSFAYAFVMVVVSMTCFCVTAAIEQWVKNRWVTVYGVHEQSVNSGEMRKIKLTKSNSEIFEEELERVEMEKVEIQKR